MDVRRACHFEQMAAATRVSRDVIEGIRLRGLPLRCARFYSPRRSELLRTSAIRRAGVVADELHNALTVG